MFEDADWILDWMQGSNLHTFGQMGFALGMGEQLEASSVDMRSKLPYWISYRIGSLLRSGYRYILRMCGLNTQWIDVEEVYRRHIRVLSISEVSQAKVLPQTFDAAAALKESHRLFFRESTSAAPFSHVTESLDHGVIPSKIKEHVDRLLVDMNNSADNLRDYYSALREMPYFLSSARESTRLT